MNALATKFFDNPLWWLTGTIYVSGAIAVLASLVVWAAWTRYDIEPPDLMVACMLSFGWPLGAVVVEVVTMVGVFASPFAGLYLAVGVVRDKTRRPPRSIPPPDPYHIAAEREVEQIAPSELA